MADDLDDKDKAENELGKQFFLFWLGPAVLMSIDHLDTYAARWFVGFPLVCWLYRKIKKHLTH